MNKNSNRRNGFSGTLAPNTFTNGNLTPHQHTNTNASSRKSNSQSPNDHPASNSLGIGCEAPSTLNSSQRRRSEVTQSLEPTEGKGKDVSPSPIPIPSTAVGPEGSDDAESYSLPSHETHGDHSRHPSGTIQSPSHPPQVCRDFLRSSCTRAQCKFHHPTPLELVSFPDYYRTLIRQVANLEVCRDFLNGRCHRGRCKYFHPPIWMVGKESIIDPGLLDSALEPPPNWPTDPHSISVLVMQRTIDDLRRQLGDVTNQLARAYSAVAAMESTSIPSPMNVQMSVPYQTQVGQNQIGPTNAAPVGTMNQYMRTSPAGTPSSSGSPNSQFMGQMPMGTPLQRKSFPSDTDNSPNSPPSGPFTESQTTLSHPSQWSMTLPTMIPGTAPSPFHSAQSILMDNLNSFQAQPTDQPSLQQHQETQQQTEADGSTHEAMTLSPEGALGGNPRNNSGTMGNYQLDSFGQSNYPYQMRSYSFGGNSPSMTSMGMGSSYRPSMGTLSPTGDSRTLFDNRSGGSPDGSPTSTFSSVSFRRYSLGALPTHSNSNTLLGELSDWSNPIITPHRQQQQQSQQQSQQIPEQPQQQNQLTSQQQAQTEQQQAQQQNGYGLSDGLSHLQSRYQQRRDQFFNFFPSGQL